MNAKMILGSGGRGMLKGDGQNLLGWVKRGAFALFMALVTAGFDQPVSLVVLAGGSVVAVTRNQERKDVCSEHLKEL
jgi:hypothetical protein